MKLNTLELLKLMPKFMRGDETTAALCNAVGPELKRINSEVDKNLVLPFVDQAPEWLLDEIAWEYNATWYDTAASIDVKRRLIKSMSFVKKHLGTVAAVERTITDYFDDGYVEEWFNYDGEPYMFRVRTTNPAVTDDLADLFRMALNNTKNVRSHLDGVYVDRRAEMPLYCAVTYHEGEILTKRLEAK